MDYALLAIVEALATSTLEPAALDAILVRFLRDKYRIQVVTVTEANYHLWQPYVALRLKA